MVESTARRKLAKEKLQSQSQSLFTKSSAVWLGIIVISIIVLSSAIGFYLLVRLGPSIPFGQRVYLASLTPDRSVVGAFGLGVGVYPFSEGPIVRGTTLQVNGIKYPYGLFTHAPSEIEYSLTRNFTSFSASIYMDGYPDCGPGLANFVVLLDGQEVYRSPDVAYGDPQTPIAISVPIHEGTTLTLKTESIGNNYCDWTVWGDPYLVPSIIP